MRRAAGFTLIELIAALALIAVASAAALPTLTRTSELARAVDERLEDSEALSVARRRLAADLRVSGDNRIADDGLHLAVDDADVVWHADESGLRRSGELVSGRVTALHAEGYAVRRITLSTASRERTFAIAPRLGVPR